MSLQKQNNKKNKHHLSALELCIFAMLGCVMFCSKIIMEAAPNIHILGLLTMVYTIVYRKKALLPIYIYVFLNGLFAGFNQWWIPYLYIWTLLWAITMLLPKKMPKVFAYVVYPLICCIHGLTFGALYAPVQALLYGFDFKQTMAWIAAGLSFDIIHAVSNFCMGLFIIPLSKLLRRLSKKIL